MQSLDKERTADLEAHAAVRAVTPMFSKVPHYVLSQELLEVMTVDMVDHTVDALMDADVARLPYKSCLVEMRQQTVQKTWGTAFLLIEQPWEDTKWLCFFIFLHDDGSVQSTVRPVELCIRPFNALQDKLNRSAKYVYETSEPMGTIGSCMAAALGMLLTLTHVRGVVKEAVTSDDLKKLNKAREAKGKQTVLPYTVFKIGHTYTSTGEKRTWAPGCKMKPHLRAGHTRRQRYGTGRNESKLIFIEPVLVNCESIDEVQFKPKVVTP